ncbi:hypothetical protein [Bdellovibrio bacteriovorus]|nr:hypothetical protein [Bdellovibrio bacteriovorus]
MRMAITSGLIFFLSAVSTQAGIYMRPQPWGDQSQIAVCFADKDTRASVLAYTVTGEVTKARSQLSAWSRDLKNRVKKLVTSEYSKEKTGVEFVGWDDCGSGSGDDNSVVNLFISTADAKKLARSTEYGRASIGPNLQYGNFAEDKAPFLYVQHPSAMAGDFIFKNRKGLAQIYWDSTILHEFGHLAGLLHEHEQKAILQDPACQRRFGKAIKNIVASLNLPVSLTTYYEQDYAADPRSPYIQHGSYDSQSIMNYCYIDEIRDGLSLDPHRLSDTDRATLREMYSQE